MSASRTQASPSPRYTQHHEEVVVDSPMSYTRRGAAGPGGRSSSSQPRDVSEARCSCGALHQLPIITEEAQATTATVKQLRGELRDAQHESKHLNEYALQLEWHARQKENDCVVADQARLLAVREAKTAQASIDELQVKLDASAREKNDVAIQLRQAKRASMDVQLQLQHQIQELQVSLERSERVERDSRRSVEALTNRVAQVEEEKRNIVASSPPAPSVDAPNFRHAASNPQPSEVRRTISPPSRTSSANARSRSSTPNVFAAAATAEFNYRRLSPPIARGRSPLRRASGGAAAVNNQVTTNPREQNHQPIVATLRSLSNVAVSAAPLHHPAAWEDFAKQLAQENSLLEALLAEKDAVIAAQRVEVADLHHQQSNSQYSTAHATAPRVYSYDDFEEPLTPLQCAGPLHGPGRYHHNQRDNERSGSNPSRWHSTLPHAPLRADQVRQQPEVNPSGAVRSPKRTSPDRSPPQPTPRHTQSQLNSHSNLSHQQEIQDVKETARVLYEVVRQLRNMLAGQLPLVDIQLKGHPIACELWNSSNIVLSRIGSSLEEPMPDEFQNVADAHRWFPRSVPGVEGSADGVGPTDGPRRRASLSPDASSGVLPTDELHHLAHRDPHHVHHITALENEIRILQADRRRFERENRDLSLQLYSGGLVVPKFHAAQSISGGGASTSRSGSRQTRPL
ncbi:Hypothetical protein, putative [Bodo saltans]|uniref:Uncharacterized protein n=1 Tax=Bodo saltans TaxID=75058 RepID=A0A0S4IZC5_BODSA|nr:Hypothetical protein, putative [Bodo saltans]|eukprot:CUG65087.1 Hypothetical protein, putative [Bodo saltans]